MIAIPVPRQVYRIAQSAPVAPVKMGGGGHMDFRRKKSRNREIFASFQAGCSVACLADNYGLTVERIQVLLSEEKNRHALSPEPYYSVPRNLGRMATLALRGRKILAR